MAPRARPPGLRKGMRKGTHSCYECRRRKVRCIFAVDSTICEGCAARGRACTEQRRELVQAAGLDTRETLRDQVARLEATIRASSSDSSSVAVYQASSRSRVDARNAQPDGAKSQSSSSASDPTPASMPSPNSPASAVKDSALNIDPIVTLFDNAIVSFTCHSSIYILRSRIVEEA